MNTKGGLPMATIIARARWSAHFLLVGIAACLADSSPTGPAVPTVGEPEASEAPPAEPMTLVGAGDIAAEVNLPRAELTAQLLDSIPGTVFTLGDNAYETGSAADYQSYYEPTWGRHKARTRPSLGDKEYVTDAANPSFDYFGDALGPRGLGYYSYDLGDWHIVVLNSNKKHVPISAGSVQLQWLDANLAASPKQCQLVYFHAPMFFSSGGTTTIYTGVKPIWDVLYRHGVEVVLNGNKHHYERFARQTPAGQADPAAGIRQFIVGAGGKSMGSASNVRQNSEMIIREYGVLKLTLSTGSYAWEYVPVRSGGTNNRPNTDTGSESCIGVGPAPNSPPVADAGGPYTGERTITFDGSGSDPDGDLPLTYTWNFGDGTTGGGATPSHTYADGSYTATLIVTDAEGASDTASTSVTIANTAPTVNAGADLTANPGVTVTVQATFSDPGTDDAPWSYSFDWGDGSAPTTGATNQASPIAASHTYQGIGTYTVAVSVTDKDGGTGTDQLRVNVVEPGGSVQLVGAGYIGRCDRTDDERTANLLDNIGGTVFVTGENALWSGTAAEYDCYNASWGRHKSRTRPSPGDKDYDTPGAAAYFDYFGAAAGDRTQGYYSYELGDWHIIALNSSISMSAGSAQEQWLRADLVANQKQCTLAYFHFPRFASNGAAPRSSVQAAWQALYEFGADVVVNSHYAWYERFAPQTPGGVLDTQTGIREFIVGTGGGGLSAPGVPAVNSEVRQGTTFGVLKLTLFTSSYGWEFVPVAGSSFVDSGSASCH
jgi:hypothetical protein